MRRTRRGAQPTHTNKLGKADATLPSRARQRQRSSMYSQAKHGQLLIKAGQVGYLVHASQPTAVSLPLLSELRYPRVAANLKR